MQVMVASISQVVSIPTGADSGFAVLPGGEGVVHASGVYSPEDGSVLRGLELQGSVSALDPSGRFVLTLFEETILMWDLETGGQAGEFRGSLNPPVQAAFSPAGGVFASAGDRYARIWDVQGGRTLHKLKKHASQTSKAVFRPDGTAVATMSPADPEVKLWDAASGNCLLTLALPQHEGNAPWMDLPQDIAWSADGSLLLTAAKELHVWDAAGGQLLRELDAKGGFYAAVCACPDGRSAIATVFYMEGEQVSAVFLRAVDLETGEVNAEVQVAAAANLTLTAGGGLLVCGSVDTVDVYRLS